MFYGHAPLVNGLFLLNLERDVTHIHSVNSNKCKVDNDSPTYLWHYRLGHIGVKRMKKLHADGLLESLDYESFDTCKPCLMGKMTKTPFSGTMERATNLFEIIHTDVRGPMNVEARGGYRYVLTLTDDLSRYGYVYLMKHKSETFEPFNYFRLMFHQVDIPISAQIICEGEKITIPAASLNIHRTTYISMYDFPTNLLLAP